MDKKPFRKYSKAGIPKGRHMEKNIYESMRRVSPFPPPTLARRSAQNR
jgi:hypothetical protein